MRTCLNNLNLGSAVRLFDILKIYYYRTSSIFKNAGTVVNESGRECDGIILYGSAKSEY